VLVSFKDGNPPPFPLIFVRFKMVVGCNVDVRFMMWVRISMAAGRIVEVIKK
jgi:hypothetical protein